MSGTRSTNCRRNARPSRAARAVHSPDSARYSVKDSRSASESSHTSTSHIDTPPDPSDVLCVSTLLGRTQRHHERKADVLAFGRIPDVTAQYMGHTPNPIQPQARAHRPARTRGPVVFLKQPLRVRK